MINNELLSKLKELNRIETAAPADIDIHRDALILLQFNRNRILYDNIIRRELYDKLKYEAGKTFQLHCARLGVNPDSMLPDPAAEMLAMEQKAKAIEPAERKEKSMRKRQDHDLLPADIRNYFDTNSDLFMLMQIGRAHV